MIYWYIRCFYQCILKSMGFLSNETRRILLFVSTVSPKAAVLMLRIVSASVCHIFQDILSSLSSGSRKTSTVCNQSHKCSQSNWHQQIPRGAWGFSKFKRSKFEIKRQHLCTQPLHSGHSVLQYLPGALVEMSPDVWWTKTNGNPLQGASSCFFDGLRRRLRCRCTKPPNDMRWIKTIKLKWLNVSLPRMPPKYKEQVLCFKSKLCHVSSKAGSHQHISTYFNIFQHHIFALFSKYNAIFKRQFLEVKLRVTWIRYLAFTTSLADRQLASNTQGMASKKLRRSDQMNVATRTLTNISE